MPDRMRRQVASLCTVGLLMLAGAGAVRAQSHALSLPIVDGTKWTFVATGTETDSAGNISAFGPFIQTLQWSASSEQIGSHQATLVENGEDTPIYYLRNNDGLFNLADGNPNDGQWYEHYVDPKPLAPEQAIPLGQTIGFDGDWEGQWELPGGGFEAWSGQWSVDFTYLGVDSVDVPLGTFDAHLFEVVDVYDQQPIGRSHINTSRGTEHIWIVNGLGLVQLMGDYLYESDFDGDGTIDETESETMTWMAASLTGDTANTSPPAFATPDYNSNGGASEAVVQASLDAVADSATTTPFGNHENNGGYGILSSLVQLVDDDVQQLISALAADGAAPEQRFVRVEIAYDEAALTSFGLAETDLAPYWWDDDADRWVLVGTRPDGTVGPGRLATLAEHEQQVGYYGIDVDADLMWFNVNHASLYAVLTPVPAPMSLTCAVAMLFFWRRR